MGRIVLSYQEGVDTERAFGIIREGVAGVGGFLSKSGTRARYKYFERELLIDVHQNRIEFSFMDPAADVMLRPIEAFAKGLGIFGKPEIVVEVEAGKRERIVSRLQNLFE